MWANLSSKKIGGDCLLDPVMICPKGEWPDVRVNICINED